MNDHAMYEELVQQALAVRKNAYVPYSGFAVGAALLGASGKIYPGCNVENASYGPTNCGERTAVFSAVAQGERRFKAIAIVGGPKDQEPSGLCPPCGVCRQVLREFCSPDFPIILGKGDGSYAVYTLEQLLPESFGPEFLE